MEQFVDSNGAKYYTISEHCLLVRREEYDELYNLVTCQILRFRKKWLGSMIINGMKIKCLRNYISQVLQNSKSDKIVEKGETNDNQTNLGFSTLKTKNDLKKSGIRNLRLELTNECNFDCVFCSKNSWFSVRCQGCRRSPDSNSSTSKLSLSEWKQVLRDAYNIGFSKLELLGGEPLLYPDLVLDIFEYAKEVGFQDLNMWTNASLLTPELINRIQKLEINLTLQIVSLKPDVHESLTGHKKTAATVLENMAYVAASWIPFRVFMPMLTENRDEKQSVVEFFNILGPKTIIHCEEVGPHFPNLEVKSSLTITSNGDVLTCRCDRLKSIGNVRNTKLWTIPVEKQL